MTAHIPENSVEAQGVGRVPDGTGLSSLRDEAADASSPKASIPSREESATAIMMLAQDILKLAPSAGLYVKITIEEASK